MNDMDGRMVGTGNNHDRLGGQTKSGHRTAEARFQRLGGSGKDGHACLAFGDAGHILFRNVEVAATGSDTVCLNDFQCVYRWACVKA